MFLVRKRSSLNSESAPCCVGSSGSPKGSVAGSKIPGSTQTHDLRHSLKGWVPSGWRNHRCCLTIYLWWVVPSLLGSLSLQMSKAKSSPLGGFNHITATYLYVLTANLHQFLARIILALNNFLFLFFNIFPCTLERWLAWRWC